MFHCIYYVDEAKKRMESGINSPTAKLQEASKGEACEHAAKLVGAGTANAAT